MTSRKGVRFVGALQAKVLTTLAERGPRTKSQLGRDLGRKPKVIWRAVRSLESLGAIMQMGTWEYRGTRYPTYWLTFYGADKAMELGYSPKKIREIQRESPILKGLKEGRQERTQVETLCDFVEEFEGEGRGRWAAMGKADLALTMANRLSGSLRSLAESEEEAKWFTERVRRMRTVLKAQGMVIPQGMFPPGVNLESYGFDLLVQEEQGKAVHVGRLLPDGLDLFMWEEQRKQRKAAHANRLVLGSLDLLVQEEQGKAELFGRFVPRGSELLVEEDFKDYYRQLTHYIMRNGLQWIDRGDGVWVPL